ncbi:unnamed protein product [Ectocarpus sp. 13 AM-2016]
MKAGSAGLAAIPAHCESLPTPNFQQISSRYLTNIIRHLHCLVPHTHLMESIYTCIHMSLCACAFGLTLLFSIDSAHRLNKMRACACVCTFGFSATSSSHTRDRT